MNKRYTAIVLLILTGVLFLNGCQLALEGEGDSKNDRFCGFYITFERIWDINRADSGEADFDGLDPAIIRKDYYSNDLDMNLLYDQGKIYAKEEKLLEDGVSSTSYVFEGIEGIPFFLAYVAANDMSQGYWTKIMDNNVFDAKGMISAEGGEMEGTIYLGLDIEGIFYLNPVYQTTDHNVYMLAGEGIYLSSGTAGSFSYDITESSKIIEGGKEKKFTNTVKLTLDRMDPNNTIVFKEMDQSDQLVASTEIKRGAIPETIYLYETTEYIIVEEYSVRVDGQPITKRSILERDDYSGSMTYECRFINEKGYAEGTVIQFER